MKLKVLILIVTYGHWSCMRKCFAFILLLFKRLSNTFLAFLQSYEIIRRIVLIINHKEWKPFGIKKRRSMKRIIKRARIRSTWLYGITNFVFITKIIIIGPKNIIAVADTAAVKNKRLFLSNKLTYFSCKSHWQTNNWGT